jgi:hypothetical protein
MDPRIQQGKDFLEVYWIQVAEKVVATAIKVYGLSKEQGDALKTVFLRPNEYEIVLR